MKMRLIALVALLITGGGAQHLAAAETEPCALLTLAEVGAALKAPATMDRPHRIRSNNVTVGGDCFYRSGRDRSTLVTLTVDAHPSGHQRTSFARGRQKPHVVEVSGVGDAAYADTAPSRPPSVTFLRGDVLVTVTVTDPLGVAEAKQLAMLAAARLPAATAESPAPSTRPPSSAQVPSRMPQLPTESPAASTPPSIDSALIGTWKFDGFTADMFWVVRADGSYRLHGWGAGNQQQRGHFEGAKGQWSIHAPNWQDAGTYTLADASTWVVTGKLGTGTWKRVWHPGQLQQNGPGHGGVCNLLRPTEVAGVLAAAVVDPEGIGARNSNTGEALEGCRYTSRLNGTDRVEIRLGSGTHFAKTYAQAKQVARQQVAVPTVGLDTYATMEGSTIALHVLSPSRIMTLALHLAPGVTTEDLPGMIELTRLAYGRLR